MAATGTTLLTLGIVHGGVAFPVLWWLLDKKGHSNSDERIWLMETFHERFPVAVVNYLCAEQEFVGQAWVRYFLLEPALTISPVEPGQQSQGNTIDRRVEHHLRHLRQVYSVGVTWGVVCSQTSSAQASVAEPSPELL